VSRRARDRETILGRSPEREEPRLPFVYILCCRDGSFYAGAAKDLAARLKKHQAGRASRYTRGRRPVSLVWSRRVRTWSRALREEARIKRLSRAEKLALMARAGVEPRG
jgi:putative endonuclease